jgi:hypothetical protein
MLIREKGFPFTHLQPRNLFWRGLWQLHFCRDSFKILATLALALALALAAVVSRRWEPEPRRARLFDVAVTTSLSSATTSLFKWCHGLWHAVEG